MPPTHCLPAVTVSSKSGTFPWRLRVICCTFILAAGCFPSGDTDPGLDIAYLIAVEIANRSIIFVGSSSQTSTERDGNLGGVAGADSMCAAAAAGEGRSGTFKAFLAAATRVASVTPNAGDGQVDWVLKPHRTYYTTTRLSPIGTTNEKGLFSFPLYQGLAIANYWTGMNADWTTSAGNTCADWTATGGNGRTGDYDFSPDATTALASKLALCSGARLVVCVSQ